MSDDEERAESSGKVKVEEAGHFDTLFIKKPSGYIIIINFILAFISFCMITGWVGDTGYRYGRFGFFVYACTHTWVALLIIFIFKLVKVPTYCTFLNWDLTFCINAFVFVILLLIGSSLMAQKAAAFNDYCDAMNCYLLGACSFFGFATMIGCVIQCFFHFKEFKGE